MFKEGNEREVILRLYEAHDYYRIPAVIRPFRSLHRVLGACDSRDGGTSTSTRGSEVPKDCD